MRGSADSVSSLALLPFEPPPHQPVMLNLSSSHAKFSTIPAFCHLLDLTKKHAAHPNDRSSALELQHTLHEELNCHSSARIPSSLFGTERCCLPHNSLILVSSSPLHAAPECRSVPPTEPRLLPSSSCSLSVCLHLPIQANLTSALLQSICRSLRE